MTVRSFVSELSINPLVRCLATPRLVEVIRDRAGAGCAASPPRQPLDSLATSAAVRSRPLDSVQKGPRHWPHASHRADLARCSRLRDETLGPYGLFASLGCPIGPIGPMALRVRHHLIAHENADTMPCTVDRRGEPPHAVKNGPVGIRARCP
jgi:hypothetical protein